MTWPSLKLSSDITRLNGNTAVGLTLPQPWQWCLRRVRLKSEVQFMHIITCETGTSVGAFSPRDNRRRSLACSHRHTHRHTCSTLSHWGTRMAIRCDISLILVCADKQEKKTWLSSDKRSKINDLLRGRPCPPRRSSCWMRASLWCVQPQRGSGCKTSLLFQWKNCKTHKVITPLLWWFTTRLQTAPAPHRRHVVGHLAHIISAAAVNTSNHLWRWHRLSSLPFLDNIHHFNRVCDPPSSQSDGDVGSLYPQCVLDVF